MEEEKVKHLIKAAKKLRKKRSNHNISEFEEEELKEIYKQLLKNKKTE